jgi:hypothetical protein
VGVCKTERKSAIAASDRRLWRLDQEAAIIEIGGAVVEMHCFGSRSNIVQTNFAVTSGRARHKHDRLGKSKTGPPRGSLDAQHKPDAQHRVVRAKKRPGKTRPLE